MKKFIAGLLVGAFIVMSVPIADATIKPISQIVENIKGRTKKNENNIDYIYKWLESECASRGISVEDCRPETTKEGINKRFE